ncbi:MAG: Co2+/Mg2+ efflux protein ApaG [Saprospiraceae bacterium]|nr:Co2+/Mg2+ efflux protein ApaG [Saprospiraceae bacterium]
METISTRGIRVSVHPAFKKEHSEPKQGQFVFSYEVIIKNESHQPVQLLSRHWYIFDSSGVKREVVGDGVIGEQPILEPGQEHHYQSWCPLMTDMGSMSGTYTMKNLESGERFEANIPKFQLIAPYKLS